MSNKVKITITLDEFKALGRVLDLGAETIVDAEDEYLSESGTTRRNNGYSADLRKTRAFEVKVYKAFKRVEDLKAQLGHTANCDRIYKQLDKLIGAK